MFDYAREPINRTAALVTSQGGCATDDTLSDEQKRENLVTKYKALEAELMSHPKGSDKRKKIGADKFKVQTEINNIRPKRKCLGLKDHILDILREELTPFQFNSIISKASERAIESESAD